jgi:hypothetical protein
MIRQISTHTIAKANKAAIATSKSIKPSGIGNYATTGTSSIALGVNGLVGPVGNPGQAGNHESEFITILGRKFELNSYLSDTTKFQLVQIDFHGILIYKSLKNMNININHTEITEYLESLLKIEERNSKLENIIEKIN